MFCRNCGQKLEDDAAFCDKCGIQVIHPKEYTDKETYSYAEIFPDEDIYPDEGMYAGNFSYDFAKETYSGKSGKPKVDNQKIIIIICVITIIILLLIAGAVFFSLSNDDSGSGSSSAGSESSESGDFPGVDGSKNGENGVASSGDGSGGDEKANESDWSDVFEIRADTIEDYGNNLNSEDYAFYDSQISDFNFWYPTEIHNSVTVDESDFTTEFGQNVQTVYFTGSGGSKLTFSISRRTDGKTIQSLTDEIYITQWNKLFNPAEILHNTESTHGKVIITGFNESSHLHNVYNMIKIEPDYVLQMKVMFSGYTSKEDENEKGYVTECLYRMCGFSDTSYTSIRSYYDYCNDIY